MDTVELSLDEASELVFKVKVEGLRQAPSSVRLVCESGNVSYMFVGRVIEQDTVQFDLPEMQGKLTEGTYPSKVEVLVENRYFAPVQFDINFKAPVKVVAEALNVSRRKPEPQVNVEATPVAINVKPRAASLKDRYAERKQQAPAEGAELIRELAKSYVKGVRK